MSPQPSVGIGIAVFLIRRRDGHFVVGKRLGSLGSGTYALPGGHLEMFETFSDCAKREVKEETGVNIGEVKYIGCTESMWASEGKHYVTIFMAGWVEDDTKPQVLEPEKCAGWEWTSWDDFPKGRELFLPLTTVKNINPTFNPFLALKALA